ncbi:hypothetical protein OH492_28730 [Vibrio chagasii]|nr:hypothetical protein [Vibrio chagasii]
MPPYILTSVPDGILHLFRRMSLVEKTALSSINVGFAPPRASEKINLGAGLPMSSTGKAKFTGKPVTRR